MRRCTLLLLSVILPCAGLAAPVAAQTVAQTAPSPPNSVRVELANGEVIIGLLVSSDGNNLVVQHPKFGRLVIPKADLLHPDQLPGPAVPSTVVVVPLPAPPPPPPSWKGEADLGISGANGNTSKSDFLAGVKAEYKTDEIVKDIDFSYHRLETQHSVTEEKARLEGRLTWPEKDSPWRTFAQGSLETDKFAEYSLRAAVAAGRGYAWYDTDETFLEGRFGLGLSKEFNSENSEITPEAVLGLDYRHKLDKTESVTASAEVYPSLKDLGWYRSIVKAAWEHKLSETSPWIFKIGAEDRYNRSPGDNRRNDFEYFASLGYTF